MWMVVFFVMVGDFIFGLYGWGVMGEEFYVVWVGS